MFFGFRFVILRVFGCLLLLDCNCVLGFCSVTFVGRLGEELSDGLTIFISNLFFHISANIPRKYTPIPGL